MGGLSMEWKEVTLGEIGTIVGGATPSTKNTSFYYGNIPWLTPKDLSVNSNKYILRGERNITEAGFKSCSCKMLPKGSVLFSSRAPIGYVAIVANDMCTNQGFKSVIPNEETDSEFLYYLLKYNKDYIASQGSGTTFAEVSGKTMKDIEVVVPKEKEDQRRIASILSSLDRKIELNNKINADLEEMAQAIFKNWFVAFEPFKDGKFVDSELGMIPEGWKVGSLGDFCNVFTGKKNTNQAIEKGLYPFFSCAPEPLASNDAIFNGKAIIIAGNGSYTGRTSFYNGGFDLYQRTYACTIREQDKENLMIFFYHMMKQFFEPTKMGGTRGSSIPYIVMGDITQQKFPYSKDWLIRFSNIANSMMDRKLRIDKENSRLSTLRDTLLPRLMSGEIELPE